MLYKALKNRLAIACSFLLFLLPILLLETRAEARVLLVPALTVSEEYTDNFFFTGPDKEEELTTVITPTLSLRYENPSIILGINYGGGIRLQLKNDAVNTYSQRVNFDIGFPALSRTFHGVDIQVTEAFERTPELPSVPLGGPARETFGTTIGRVDTSRNAASLGLAYSWSKTWKTDFTYRNTIVRYQGSEGSVLENFISHNADIMGTYNISQTTHLTATYGILNTRFALSDGFTEHRVSLGGLHAMSSTFSTHGSLGESFLPNNASILIATLGLTKRVERADITFNYLRRVTTGEGIVAAATLAQTLSAGVTYPISLNTVFVLGLDRTHTNGLSALSLATIVDANTVTAAATTTFLPWLTGSLRYSHLNHKREGIGLNRNMITFFLTASDQGLRLLK